MRTILNKPLRWTSQRELLLQVLREAGGHLDADELFRRARQRDPRISLSTVYRSLRLFRELGLVKELHFDQGHHRYELCREGEHHHFLCRRCGRVLEFDSPLLSRLKEEVERRLGGRVERMEMHMEGYCERCLKRGR